MKDQFTKKWIIEHAIPIVREYDNNITLRALHYRLVSIGMTNDTNHYKRVVSAMSDARWSGDIGFDCFIDHERDKIGCTDYYPTNPEESASLAIMEIKSWADFYNKNRWENQPIYPEVFIEKKALISAFEDTCRKWDIALNACKGYSSITFLYEAAKRFKEAFYDKGKKPVILYFGDYDPSGDDIPRSIDKNLQKLNIRVEIRRIALLEEQVIKMKLPTAPTKITDTRSKKWSGIGQVELDAVEPRTLKKMLTDSILDVFDQRLYDDLLEAEHEERKRYRNIIRDELKSEYGL